MNISELNNNDKFRVRRITLGKEIGKRLADMGFTEGAEGKVVRSALFGDPIQVNIRNYNISIRKSEAARVEVENMEILQPVLILN
jgi:ferrous iron transport protein A